jgi:hypothetical protein
MVESKRLRRFAYSIGGDIAGEYRRRGGRAQPSQALGILAEGVGKPT